MPNADQVKADAKFFGLFVGRSSAGKSVAEYSFPKPIRVEDSDLRKGFLGVRDWLPIQGISINPLLPRKAYMQDYIDDLNSIETLFNAGQRPYETIIIDALGSMCRIFAGDAKEYLTGTTKGALRLSQPPDYKFVTQACYDVFDFLKSLPCNVIVAAHIQPVWGKGSEKDRQGQIIEYQPEVVVGTQLAGVSRNLSESVLGYFDEVYEFSKSADGSRHYVDFHTDIARTVFNLPTGKQDITKKPFYPYWKELVMKGEVGKGATTSSSSL